MGTIALVLLLLLEAFLLIRAIATKTILREEKAVIRIAVAALFGLLLITGIFEWSFRYVGLPIVVVIQAITAVVILVRKRRTDFRLGRTIARFVANSFVLVFALSLAILCPQYKQPEMTGSYAVETAKYTWTDASRLDTYSTAGENRALTVEFWYPEGADQTYPLVVFSHGAFGFSGSNYSTFSELASNGYVVASIGHTHQAFYTMDTSGKLTIVDTNFLSEATAINADQNAMQEEEIFNTTQEWMKLRTDDENFVIDTILAESTSSQADALFSLIDTDKIGLMGHSLGGASSAQVARLRSDIDAVIVLDGTMLGEEVGFDENGVVLNSEPYPVPLLNVYAEDHYTNSMELIGDEYNNFYVTAHALCAYETVFRDAGHLNFTDLPLFSPALAKMLGVGTVDARACIENMNAVVLEFFDSYLKDTGEPIIAKEY